MPYSLKMTPFDVQTFLRACFVRDQRLRAAMYEARDRISMDLLAQINLPPRPE